jgi:hypothetical protein
MKTLSTLSSVCPCYASYRKSLIIVTNIALTFVAFFECFKVCFEANSIIKGNFGFIIDITIILNNFMELNAFDVCPVCVLRYILIPK